MLLQELWEVLLLLSGLLMFTSLLVSPIFCPLHPKGAAWYSCGVGDLDPVVQQNQSGGSWRANNAPASWSHHLAVFACASFPLSPHKFLPEKKYKNPPSISKLSEMRLASHHEPVSHGGEEGHNSTLPVLNQRWVCPCSALPRRHEDALRAIPVQLPLRKCFLSSSPRRTAFKVYTQKIIKIKRILQLKERGKKKIG